MPPPIFSYTVIVSGGDAPYVVGVVYTGVPPVNITVAFWVCVAGRPEFCTASLSDSSERPWNPRSLSALISVSSKVKISFILDWFEHPSPWGFPFHHSALNHTTPPRLI